MTTQEKIQELQVAAMRETKNRRLYERYQAIYLWLNGYKQKEIAHIIQRDVSTIREYRKAYEAGGISALEMGHSSGKPPKLSAEQRAILAEMLASKTPAEMGFPTTANWTLSLIVQWVEREWQISYSLRGMSFVLHHLGFSHTRPTYTLEKADVAKQKEFVEQTFPALKKLLNEEIDHILFQDESMIRDYQAIQKTWFLRGKQRIIPTYGKHQGVKLLGTLNYETGEIFCVEEEKYDAQVFLSFLEQVLMHYPTGKIIMILDNSRIHHAKRFQTFLLAHQDRLQFVFLPPYSPQLNLIEGLWKWLKEAVINNVFFFEYITN